MLDARYQNDAWGRLVAAKADVSGVLAVLLGVSLVAGAYVAGYVTRELAFKLLAVVDRFVRAPTTAGELHTQLCAVFGREAVDDCYTARPVLGRFLKPGTGPIASQWRRFGRSHRGDNAYEAFNYAKLWLGEFVPRLAPANVEAEINMLLATLFPVGVGAWTVLALGEPGALGAAAVVLVAAVLYWILPGSTVQLRRAERWEALASMVEVHALRRWAAEGQQQPE